MWEKKNYFKKALFGMIVSVLLVCLVMVTGCGEPAQKKPEQKAKTVELGKLEKIKKAGKLIVGTSAEYPPYEFHLLKDKQSELVGLDIDIANSIAKSLGVELEIKDIVFHQLFQALNSDEVDLVIAGLMPSEKRKNIVDFSNVYYHALQNMVIRDSDKGKITCVGDLRGKKIGTQKGSIQGDMVRKVAEASEFLEMDTIDELIEALKTQQLDAVILEKPVADSYVFRNKDLINIECTGEKGDLGLQFGSAIAIKKGNSDLLAEVNTILEKLKTENKITEFVEDAMALMKK